MKSHIAVHLARQPSAGATTEQPQGLSGLYGTTGANTSAMVSALAATGAHLTPAPNDRLGIQIDSVDDSSPKKTALEVAVVSEPVEADPTPRQAVAPPQKKTAWRCAACSYCVVAMDHEGNPIPYTPSAWGEPLPMRCPRCQVEHASWKPDVPFDELGQHTNVRSRLSNHYMNQHSMPPPPAPAPPPLKEEVVWVQHTDGTDAPPARVGRRCPPYRMSYYCAYCQRRLLRVDADGEPIAMTCGTDGAPLPIECPGCHRLHQEWVLANRPPPPLSS